MRFAALAALVIIGTFNREVTGVLICLMVFAAYPRRWQWWLPLGVLITGIIVGLRLWIQADQVYTIPHIFRLNLEPWRLQNLMLYGGLLLLPLGLCYAGWRRTPPELRRRVAMVALPYLALYFVFGQWSEVRLLMPLFLLSVPLVSYHGFAKGVNNA